MMIENRNEQMLSLIDQIMNILNYAKQSYQSGEPEEEYSDYESRDMPNLVAPTFMKASARRGLALHEEGYSGDGLRPQTVEDARKMANGTALSPAKWRKISPWIARHTVDLSAVQGDEITPGLVAMLLWGGGSSGASASRAKSYAERIVAQLEEDRSQPRDPDGKFGSGSGGSDSAPQKPVPQKIDSSDADQAAKTKLAPSNKPVIQETLVMTKDKNINVAEKGQRGVIANWQVTDSEGNHVGSIKQVREKAPRYAPNPDATVTTFYARPRARITAKAVGMQQIDLKIGLEGSVGSSSKEVALKTLASRHNRILAINAAQSMDGRSMSEEDRAQPRTPDGKFGSSKGEEPSWDQMEKEMFAEMEKEDEMAMDEVGSLIQAQEDYAEGLSRASEAVLVDYASTGHTEVNKSQRGAPPPPLGTDEKAEALKKAQVLSDAIDGAPTNPEALTVFRGVSAEAGAKLSGAKVGSTVEDFGFVSTSVSRTTAEGFAVGEGKGAKFGKVLRIEIPRGAKVLAMDPFSSVRGEYEVLIQRGSTFKITGQTSDTINLKLVVP